MKYITKPGYCRKCKRHDAHKLSCGFNAKARMHAIAEARARGTSYDHSVDVLKRLASEDADAHDDARTINHVTSIT